MNAAAIPETSLGERKPVPVPVQIRRMPLREIRTALAAGLDDLRHCRTDGLLMAAMFPVAGLVFAGIFVLQGFLQLVFPLLAGFALVGPLATLWFAALSRQRERGDESVLSVFTPERLKAIKRLSGITILVYLTWNVSAILIYTLTLGSSNANPKAFFFTRVLTTQAGWEMLVLGCAVGAVFAVLTLTINCISFALVLDRQITASQAIAVSVQAMRRNPLFVFAWGAVVAAGLALGALPCLLGFVVVLPVLGHASWHVYRRMVV